MARQQLNLLDTPVPAWAHKGPMEEAFWAFHGSHPYVYRYLVQYARSWRSNRGPGSRLGIAALFERVRWELYMTIPLKDPPKLNNNHRAFYARLIMETCPDLQGIFKLRQQRLQATIGPKNETLDPNIHVVGPPRMWPRFH